MKINSNTSIFIQLADQIRTEIYSKRRKPGSKLESIRDMALKLEVNPNTIKRVYKVLDEEGLVYKQSTVGYYVVDDASLIEKHRDLYIQNKFNDFLIILKACNVDQRDFMKNLGGDK